MNPMSQEQYMALHSKISELLEQKEWVLVIPEEKGIHTMFCVTDDRKDYMVKHLIRFLKTLEGEEE